MFICIYTSTHTGFRCVHKDGRNQSVKELLLLHYKLVVGFRFPFNIQLMSCGFSLSSSQPHGTHLYTFFLPLALRTLSVTSVIVLFTQIILCYIELIAILTTAEKENHLPCMPVSVFLLRDYIHTIFFVYIE